MKYHPDRNQGDGAKEAEDKFKEAKEAYEMLSDAQKRAAYDQYGHAGVDPNQGFRGAGGGEGFGGFAEAFGDIFGDIFGQQGGGGRRAGGGQQVYRGSDLSYAMEITLEEAARGKETQIRIPSWEGCETCHGSGAKPGTSAKTCGSCGGSGTVHMRQGFFSIQQTCPHCHGTGKIIPEPCTTCNGAGKIKKTKTLEVKDPGGHRRRHAHPLQRQRRAWHQRRPAGRPRDGDDLHCTMPVSMTTAALGGSIEVPTLGGKAEISIPEGTQSGKTFRLRGKGIRGVRGSYPGDLYCHVSIETPVKLTEASAQAAQGARQEPARRRRASLAQRQELDRSRQGPVQVSERPRRISVRPRRSGDSRLHGNPQASRPPPDGQSGAWLTTFAQRVGDIEARFLPERAFSLGAAWDGRHELRRGESLRPHASAGDRRQCHLAQPDDGAAQGAGRRSRAADHPGARRPGDPRDPALRHRPVRLLLRRLGAVGAGPAGRAAARATAALLHRLRHGDRRVLLCEGRRSGRGGARCLPRQALHERGAGRSIGQRAPRKTELKAIFEAIDAREFGHAADLCLKRFQQRATYWLYAARIGAELLLRLERHAEARELYEAIIAARTVPWARLGVARTEVAGGNLAAARRTLETLIGDLPEQADSYDLMGRVQMEQGEIGAALATYRTAATLTPGCLLRQQHCGTLAFYAGQRDEALKMLERSMAQGLRSKLFDWHSLTLIALMRFDAKDGKGLKYAADAMQWGIERSPRDARLRRFDVLLSGLRLLLERRLADALDVARRFAKQADAEDFDLESASLLIALWVRMARQDIELTEMDALMTRLGMRFCSSKSATEVMASMAEGHEPSAQLLREAQSRVFAISEAAMRQAMRGDAQTGVQLLVEQGTQTLNAKLIDMPRWCCAATRSHERSRRAGAAHRGAAAPLRASQRPGAEGGARGRRGAARMMRGRHANRAEGAHGARRTHNQVSPRSLAHGPGEPPSAQLQGRFS
ncbi:dnaJ central domain-containing protein [Ditylenchus destructor]|nr:dnaJ central domain-containing protein [Ditylenchus destructor]